MPQAYLEKSKVNEKQNLPAEMESSAEGQGQETGKVKRTGYNKGKNNPMYGKFGKRSPAWKGEKAGYHAIHWWINSRLGKPKKCSNCKTISAKKYEWANISGKYLRNISDYKRLCTKCHHKMDEKTRAKGERQGRSKLKNKDILEIRKSYIFGKHGYGCGILAKKFNVDKGTIRLIIHKINWKHI